MTCQGKGYVPCSSNADCSAATAAAPSAGCGTCDPPGWTALAPPTLDRAVPFQVVGRCVVVTTARGLTN